jgi:hypothetical protein
MLRNFTHYTRRGTGPTPVPAPGDPEESSSGNLHTTTWISGIKPHHMVAADLPNGRSAERHERCARGRLLSERRRHVQKPDAHAFVLCSGVKLELKRCI